MASAALHEGRLCNDYLVFIFFLILVFFNGNVIILSDFLNLLHAIVFLIIILI